MKRRAEEHKKSNTTEGELKNLAARGDAAAAYRLAEDKKMDQDTYDAFIKINKNPELAKSINTKVKQNRADIVATYEAMQSAQNKVNSMTSADINNERMAAVAARVPGAAVWTDDQVKDHVARQEMDEKVEEEIGKLNAEKFTDQNWVEITKGTMTPDKIRILTAAAVAISNMAPSARVETAKRLSPANRAALKRTALSELGINLPI